MEKSIAIDNKEYTIPAIFSYSAVSINVFNLAGWTSLKYSRCIRPYFPIGRCSSGSFKSGI